MLVFDDLSAETKRRFDWFYHSTGKIIDRGACSTTVEASLRLYEDFPGMEYVANVSTGTTDVSARIVFRTGNVTTHVVSDASPGTQVLIGDGPQGSVLRRAPLVRLTRSGQNIQFAVALEVVEGEEKPMIVDVSRKIVDGCVEITITKREGGGDRITISPDGEARVFQNVIL